MGCSLATIKTVTVSAYKSTCTPGIVYCPCNNTNGNSLNSWVQVATYFSPCGFTFSNYFTQASDGYNNAGIMVVNPANGLSHSLLGWTCSDGHLYKDTATLQSILSYLLGSPATTQTVTAPPASTPVPATPGTTMPAIFLTDGIYQSVLSTISSYQQQMQNYVKWITSAGYDPCNEAAAMAKLYSQGFLSDSALENTYIYMANILNEIVGMIDDINNTSYVGGYVGSQMGFSVTTNSSGQVVVTNNITGFTATIGC